ncbi:MAG: TauD/TfdA family dioxygenase [Candidatus Rokubacteria bacterium]|nr:TauD/TfdA family dioxygenase [Candidatus Rokubacteria bacterium]
MADQAIQVEKLTPHIGAEIHGVDLGQLVDEPTFTAIHASLIEHGVVFFRDQHLTPEQQKAFGRRFGELHIHPAAPSLLEGHPEILVIHADETSKHVAGEEWHSDVSCDPALSEPMRRFLEPLTAMHEGEHVYRGRYGVKDEGTVFPKAEHPVIRTHPVSGRPALFVNRGFTTRICQLTRPESDAVLQFLFRHVETPEFQCRFRWRARSLAFWDNRCVQHHALWDYYPQRRYGRRVTIRGDKPFYRP